MWDVLGNVVVAVVLIGVALLFAVDAMREPTVPARIAAFLAIAAGVSAGFHLWTPWLPLAVLVAAAALYAADRARHPTRRDQSTASET